MMDLLHELLGDAGHLFHLVHPLHLADAPVHCVLQEDWLPEDCRVGESQDLLSASVHLSSLDQKLVLDLKECLGDGDGQMQKGVSASAEYVWRELGDTSAVSCVLSLFSTVVFTVVFGVFGAGCPRKDSLCGLRYSSVHHREVGVSRSDLRGAQGQVAHTHLDFLVFPDGVPCLGVDCRRCLDRLGDLTAAMRRRRRR